MNRSLSSVLALAFFACAAHAQQSDGLLPVDQAFKIEAKALDRERVEFDVKVAPDYYLYRERIHVKSKDPAVTLGATDLPAGEKKHDEFLNGDFELYHHDFAIVQHLTAPSSTAAVSIELGYQGCHQVDPKICFPPQKKTFSILLPAAAGGTSLTTALGTAPTGTLLGNGPLPAEQAFVFEAIATGPDEVLARFTMPKGYYLYRDKTHFSAPADSGVSLAAPRWRPGTEHTDANFGTTTVYYDQVEVPIGLTRTNAAAQTLALTANFQGCLENSVCYPVITRTVNVPLPAAGGAASAANAGADTAQQARPETQAITFGGVLVALFGALVGGLILNLMPCVLPVLSLKAISILEGGETPQKARKHVLFYTAGVMLSFAFIGLTVIALRAAGLAYGWGFQLQQPLFVAVLVYVVVAVGLSLSGVVQFGVGLTGAGQELTARSGPSGDFFTGVLAVVVATPCTAPFMGSALAYALTSPPPISFLVFLTLGLGLALPFLLIGFVPALGRYLPRPGAWMETLKQILAFPMYLTAVWLIWVLGNQRGVDAVALALIGIVVLAWACWWFERNRYGSNAQRALAFGAAILALLPLYEIAHIAPKAVTASFSMAKIEELRRSGKSIFVDIGADWCTTCKLNEHAVLATDAFQDLLKRTDTEFVVGDWTNPDPEIEAFLAKFHAVGVPLYVVYRHGDEGHALPTVLTEGIVEAALEDKPR
ncbi:MAG TPA: protein-disulfide reductase DsbD [Rudaea sp.]|nr:protein-disulfide reductase DsbD [Rudaea sp.]